MDGERGFSLIEVVVAVAIAAIVLVAGGVWMLGMHPGALRQAADDFDADLNAARAIAASSGNGATIAFLPRAGKSGFVLRVYSGRPTAANAVTASNVMILENDASVREATFGAPPFALFLSSAGYPTGVASYPNVAANGAVSFQPIAKQPPCPASGVITLTFSNAQHATVVRTLRCDAVVVGAAQPVVTPTPNPPRLSPARAVAHWTRDAYPLHFTAAEYGYTHWYASDSGASCETQGSDTGAAPAVFPSPWPYIAPGPNEPASPAPPNAPYSYPDLRVADDPPAHFAMQPVAGNGGTCRLRIVDDYGQEVASQIQVMGDLTPAPTSLTFASPTASAQRVTLGKTWDSEAIALAYGGNCANIVSIATVAANTPGSPSGAPATVTISVAPLAAGTCTMQFTDQYREPWASVAVTVKSLQKFKTWPAQLTMGANGAAVELTTASGQVALTPQAHVAEMMNALLGGGVALANTYSGPCYARALGASGSGPDTTDANLATYLTTLGIWLAPDGCELNADGSGPYGTSVGGGASGTPTGVMIAYEPGGQPGSYGYTLPDGACAAPGSWYPNLGRNDVQAALPATGATQGTCTVDISDGTSTSTPAPDAGQVAVNVVCGVGKVDVGGTCDDLFFTESPCAGYTFYAGGGNEYLCSPPLTQAQSSYTTMSIAYYYAPPGDEGTRTIYTCPSDDPSGSGDDYTGTQTAWVEFAHEYSDGSGPPDNFGNYPGVANGIYNQTITLGWNGNANTAGLTVANEVQATLMPTTVIKHKSPPACNAPIGPPVP